MDFEIRQMNKFDEDEILLMMEEFYQSDAVYTSGSREIFINDYKNCINDNPYLEGYVFCIKDKILGYSMIAKSFSTEFGKNCLWFEDLFVKKEYRCKGIITNFFQYIEKKYPNYLYKLEVEEYNKNALFAYKKSGFLELPYKEMVKYNF